MGNRAVPGAGRKPAIAVIGMAGRFPGADDVDTFWQNISTGAESFTHFSDEELIEAGVGPELLQNPDYVKARPVLGDIRGFDAGFFGYSPRDATLADPQQRVFLECVWEALEAAGYAGPERRGTVGVFAGMNASAYLITRITTAIQMGVDQDGLMIGNDKDALATNVSFRLDLRGPSVAVQTFCSTSLVSVHLAKESLLRGECDLALAGGVSIRIPDRVGYLYQEGGQASPDAHVRTFDAQARGSMFGDGAAVVVLKRLEEAIADRDTVLAVIRGSAINNDGALKFSFQAPSIDGQRRCVASAIADAGVDPSEISYVEAHGTATEVGDPMEVAALTSAFGPTDDKQYCVLGSIKPNVGHLDRASGGTGLIKVIQSLRHELIPGTLHFRTPNPEIDLDVSPFRVTAEPTAWPRRDDRPRIAGISSLGMGGTNVHTIVSEAPPPPPRPERPRRWQVLPLSARSAEAAASSCARLADHLAAAPDLDLGDVAYTLQVGRRTFNHRRFVVADSTGAAAAQLADETAPLGRTDTTVGRQVGFLIAGVGEQYPGMVAALYDQEPTFRADVDECLAVLGLTGVAQLSAMFLAPAAGTGEAAGDLARLLGRASGDAASGPDPHLVQPAVFVAEYALARLLLRWGIRPEVMVGYSLGEYVAACLSGVLSLPDALRLVAHRAKLITSLPEGAMLAVAADEQRLAEVLGDLPARDLDIAVRTGSQPVLAGPVAAVEAAAAALRAAEIGCRPLDTTHAYHSRMLAPVAAELTAWITDNVTLCPPGIPYASNVTGALATAELVTDPGYWARHMCETVEFGAGLATLLGAGGLALVEVGPGQSLGALTRVHPDCDRTRWPLIVPTLPGATEQRDPHAALAEAVGKLWLAGVAVDWPALHETPAAEAPDAGPRWVPGRVPLPGYPFEHQEFWLEADPAAAALGTGGAPLDDGDPFSIAKRFPRLPDPQWLHLPVWRQTTRRPPRAEEAGARWLVYTDAGPADTFLATLRGYVQRTGGEVVLVRPGDRYATDPDGVVIRPGSPEDSTAALRALAERGFHPDRVVHMWTMDGGGRPGPGPVADGLRRGIHTLVALARAAGDLGIPPWSLDVVTTGSHKVLPADPVHPERATSLGACRIIPVEYSRVRTRFIDVDRADAAAAGRDLLGELRAEPVDQLVALRGGRRWVPDYQGLDEESCRAFEAAPAVEPRRGGTYLVTGGLGGIGLAMAERLVAHYQANVVLLGRTPVPPRDRWAEVLDSEHTTGEVRRRLEGLQRIVAAGGDVVTVAGDVAQVDDVRRAVAAARERFGGLHGVLHCAGVPAVGLMQFKSAADIDRVLAPKVAGTLAIAAAVRDEPVDFVALFSTVATATGGGAGQVDYCTANIFLDAFAQSDPLPGCAVTSIDWCEWTWNGWTDGLEGYDEGSRRFFEWYRDKFGLTFDDGWLALRRVLASGEPHLVVSTQDFAPLVEMSRHSSLESHQATVKRIRDSLGRHPRPDLATAYVEPQSPEEETIVEVWAEALGLEQVGVNDNFFELGGNSLIGMEIIAEVRKRLDLTYLPPHLLYQAPTVASLAEAALAEDQAGGEPADAEDPAAAPAPAAPAAADARRQARIEQRRSMLRTRIGRTS